MNPLARHILHSESTSGPLPHLRCALVQRGRIRRTRLEIPDCGRALPLIVLDASRRVDRLVRPELVARRRLRLRLLRDSRLGCLCHRGLRGCWGVGRSRLRWSARLPRRESLLLRRRHNRLLDRKVEATVGCESGQQEHPFVHAGLHSL